MQTKEGLKGSDVPAVVMHQLNRTEYYPAKLDCAGTYLLGRPTSRPLQNPPVYSSQVSITDLLFDAPIFSRADANVWDARLYEMRRMVAENSGSVSARHAQLDLCPQGLTIQDLGSKLGTSYQIRNVKNGSCIDFPCESVSLLPGKHYMKFGGLSVEIQVGEEKARPASRWSFLRLFGFEPKAS